MQKQLDPIKLSFFRQLIPHRQIALTLSTPIEQAYQRLDEAFAGDISLGGSFVQWPQHYLEQIPRHYWGHINGNQFVLHGPEAYRQFCFRTRGFFAIQGEQLVLELWVQLSRRDVFGLLYVLAFVFGFLFFVVQEVGVVFIPFPLFFLGFIYLAVQWHLSYYAAEISKFVADIVNGTLLNFD